MKLKYHFVTGKVLDKQTAVSVDDKDLPFNGMFVMNDTAAFIFSLLKEETTLADILDKLKREFPDTDEQRLRDAAETFTAKLYKADVLI